MNEIGEGSCLGSQLNAIEWKYLPNSSDAGTTAESLLFWALK